MYETQMFVTLRMMSVFFVVQCRYNFSNPAVFFVSSVTSVAPGGASYGRRDLLLLIYPSSLLSKSFPLMDFLSNHVGSSIPQLWFILHFQNVLNYTKHIHVMLYPKIKNKMKPILGLFFLE